MAFRVDPKLVKRFGAVIMVVNLAVAFFSFTDMYLLASGAIQVEYPEQEDFETSYDALNMEFVFRSEYKVTNDGFYDVNDLDIRSRLGTHDGKLLVLYNSTDLEVPRWSTRTFPIEARLPFERLLDLDMKGLLFNDSSFILDVTVGADYVMGLVHFKLDQSGKYPWKAPLKNYTDILGNGTLKELVREIMGNDYGEAVQIIEKALIGAFLDAGGEVHFPLNDYSELVVSLQDSTVHIKVDLTSPFKVNLVHFELPLEDMGFSMPEEGGVNDGS